MEITFTDLKQREVINVFDGKKLGRITDLVFDIETGKVEGIIVPGEKKIFRKTDDIFIPLEKLKRIGDDLILIGIEVKETSFGYNFYSDNAKLEAENQMMNFNNTKNIYKSQKSTYKGQSQSNNESYIRFHRLEKKKYR